MFKAIRVFVSVAVLSVFSIGVMLNDIQQVAALCSGSGCRSLDPQSAGCGATGVTVASLSGSGTYGSAFVELRYSTACVANWTRVKNTGNAYYTFGKATEQTGSFYSQGIGPASIGVNSQIYTKMVDGNPVVCSEGGKTPFAGGSGTASPYIGPSGLCG